jgi:integrase
VYVRKLAMTYAALEGTLPAISLDQLKAAIAGAPLSKDPTRPITSFKTSWTKVRKNAGVEDRWHDNRHTLVTELAESGAGDEAVMSIVGHASRAMLSRYSRVRMEAKRRALDEIATRQRAADEKRQQAVEGNQSGRSRHHGRGRSVVGSSTLAHRL